MLKKIERKISAFYNARPHRLVAQKPVISFTFDDVPASAIEVGAKILEKYHTGGTFYLSASLAGGENLDLPQYKLEDINRLMDGGHEIGCHTYGHVNIQDMKKADIENDLSKSHESLKKHLGDHDIVSFSYPFGCTSVTAKNIIRKRFATGRGIAHGLNKGLVDLSQLKANPLYTGQMTNEKIDQLIKGNTNSKSWLIFYTHDISDNPTPYGCTADLFEYAVKTASESGAEVLPMRNALAKASFRAQ